MIRHDKINTKCRKFRKDTAFLASKEIDYSESKEKPFITSLLTADQNPRRFCHFSRKPNFNFISIMFDTEALSENLTNKPVKS